MTDSRQIPLFPLPNVVHFPHTDLKLHIFEPRYRTMIRDLVALEESERLVGMVLMYRDEDDPEDATPIYESGTAGLLREVEYLPDGRSNIVLEGQFRFRISEELPAAPYRRALIEPLSEVRLQYPDDRERREEILELVSYLQRSAIALPIAGAEASELPLEALVNGLAAHLDLPVLAKLDLLIRDLDARSSRVLDILQARKRVVDLLRPFRGLEGHPDRN